jgi:hypothetical protein
VICEAVNDRQKHALEHVRERGKVREQLEIHDVLARWHKRYLQTGRVSNDLFSIFPTRFKFNKAKNNLKLAPTLFTALLGLHIIFFY